MVSLSTRDSQLQDISIYGPANCGIGTNCNSPHVLQFESTKELSGPVIIILDCEGECFEEISLHGLHGKIIYLEAMVISQCKKRYLMIMVEIKLCMKLRVVV